ncbi:MAG: hypothetical protein JST16_00385 [Bdellovibrionales bacterium]|nr:hypothetical protein [Bdellovibrionales bacterium]
MKHVSVSRIMAALGAGTLALVCGSCASPFGKTSGDCTTSQGTVNTYHIYGQKWKKLTPYSDGTRSTAQLKLDYELMIVESGATLGTTFTPICAADIVNAGLSSVLYRGRYTNNVDTNKLTIEYTEGTDAGQNLDATYSFSGSCDTTQMTLTYSSGLVETYALFSTSVNSGDCTDPNSTTVSGLSN